MTRSELERAVARVTGESRHTVRRYGFNLIPPESEEPDNPSLAVDCPGCGARLAIKSSHSTDEFVECPRCDAVYPFSPDELYAADVPSAALAASA